MHILLVNDDGITAKGIHALAKAALKRGHRLTVCAPSTQQSAMSQHISLIDPIYLKSFPFEGAKGYAVTGSPTDCVRLALRQLMNEPVDLCLSGINDGWNAGFATYYSATVGAAREAALNGVKSVAASIHHQASEESLAHFADITITLSEQYAQMDAPKYSVLNLNAPKAEPRNMNKIMEASISTSAYLDHYVKMVSPRMGTVYWMDVTADQEPSPEGSDIDLLEKGYITYTLMGLPQRLSLTGGAKLRLMPEEQ